jgi:hypothetical protein
MFCPQCKAEYRQGFTRCADCDVDLVWELPKEGLVAYSPHSPGDPDKDPYCSFWKGDDPRLHTELCQLLDEEGIPHKTVRRADHLFHLSKYPAFQIGIPFSLFDRAEAAVKEAYGTEEQQQNIAALLPEGSEEAEGARPFRAWLPENRGFVWFKKETEEAGRESPSTAIPEELTAKEEEAVSRSDWDPENWYPEDAVVEVWSGGSPEFAEMLASSLQENEIHSRQKQTADKLLLLVLPQDESRAREIVHEVVDGIPPQ